MDKVGKRNGIRQTMSRPNLPRALAAGAKILTGWRAQRIQKSRLVWSIEARQQNGERRLFLAQKVLLCGGAIQTPLLLHRSSIRGCIFALPTLLDAFMVSITSLLTMLAPSQQHLALIHKGPFWLLLEETLSLSWNVFTLARLPSLENFIFHLSFPKNVNLTQPAPSLISKKLKLLSSQFP
ncbi:MAG: GMC family oxidoreductase N-terminal domain-containing protein [Chthoniobacterales bacterium]|nr:GMC family oxidoreductase N-terminal domain-containing protein [Chthoniobacterales bacterium]